MPYTFRIINLYKRTSMYNAGLRPLLYSDKAAVSKEGHGWFLADPSCLALCPVFPYTAPLARPPPTLLTHDTLNAKPVRRHRCGTDISYRRNEFQYRCLSMPLSNKHVRDRGYFILSVPPVFSPPPPTPVSLHWTQDVM